MCKVYHEANTTLILTLGKVGATSTLPTCGDSPYGCCSDGVTAAKGPNNEGCSQVATYATPLMSTPPPTVSLSKCQQEQQNAKAIQCYTFPGDGYKECWCVNQVTGMELAGTRVKGSLPTCKGIHYSHMYWKHKKYNSLILNIKLNLRSNLLFIRTKGNYYLRPQMQQFITR